MLEKVRRQIHIDPQAALQVGERGLASALGSGDKAAIAEAKIGWVVAIRNVGRFQEALTALDEAKALFEASDNYIASAQADTERVRTLMYMGQYAEAEDVYRTARPILKGKLDIARLDTNIGIVYAKSGRFQEAKDRLKAACRTFQEVEAVEDRALAMANLATVHISLDEVQVARGLFEQCSTFFQQQGMSVALAKIDLERAFLSRRTGRYDQALEYLIEGQETFDRLGMQVEQLIAKLHAAEIYLQLNLISEALESAEESGNGFEKLGMKYNVALAYAVSGKAYDRLGETERGLAALREARHTFEELDARSQVAEVDWDLSEHFLKTGEHQAALGAAMNASRVFAEEHITSSRLLADLNIGEAHRREGRTKEALEILSQTLKDAPARHLDEVTYQAVYSMGKIQEASGDLKAALDSYQKAISGIENIRDLLGVEDYRISFAEGRMSVFEDAVTLALRLEQRELAFNLVERAKSKTLIDIMLARAEGRYEEEDARLSDKMRSLREDLNWLYYRIKQEDDASDGPSGSRQGPHKRAIKSKLVKRTDRVEKRLVELMRRKGVQSPLSDQAATVSIRQVQHLLDENTVAIEYYQARSTLIVFIIERNAWDVVELNISAEDVQEKVALWEFGIEQFSFGSEFVKRHQRKLLHQATRHLTALYHQLIHPIESWIIGKERLFIIPHGPIHKVPFHALWNGETYLDDIFEISYAPSLTVLVHSLNQKETQIKHALVVGASDERTPRLAEEVKQVGQMFDHAQVMLDDTTVEEKLYAYAPQCDLLHLACHGIFREDNPRFSSLLLNGTRLMVDDIMRVKLHASLVTLSACQSGVSKITAGDELLGLVRAFLAAGAKSLLVSMWWVDDQATTELMTSFYGRLKAGMGRASALREAQISLRQRYPHPYYWAPFVLVGG